MKNNPRWFTRVMNSSDESIVMEIERRSHREPWAADQFGFGPKPNLPIRCTKGVTSHVLIEHIQFGHKIGDISTIYGGVIGYCVWATYRTHLEIWNIAVHPDYRRLGAGSTLLREVTSHNQDGSLKIVTKVDELDLTSQLFLKANKFYCVGQQDRHASAQPQTLFVFEHRPLDPAALLAEED